MNIITISRKFGSGGRELGLRLAELLNYDYYDSQIIAAVSQQSGLDPAFVKDALIKHAWKSQPLTYRRTLGSAAYTAQSTQISLLLKQKEVIEGIASLGRDCLIVGRNADILLANEKPFNLFVCASGEARLRRCRERTPQGEKLTEKELLRKMKQVDRIRSQTRELMSGSSWGQRDNYHLTVNTTDWDLTELAAAVADFAARWFRRKQ